MRYVLTAILLLILAITGYPVRAASPTPIYLVGPGGTGGTVGNPTASAGSADGPFGSSTAARVAQLFVPTTGTLSIINVRFGANGGTPVGTATWTISIDTEGIPGTVLQSGTFTPTPSAVNIITVASGIFLQSTYSYWIEFTSTGAQTVGNNWNLRYDTTNPYANGYLILRNAGTTWSLVQNRDLVATLVTVAGSVPAAEQKFKLAQSFTAGSTTEISAASLYLLKVGLPTGTLTLEIQTDAGNIPSGFTLPDASATAAESSLSTSFDYTDFTFAAPISLEANTKYWLVLTTDRIDDTKYIAWGTGDVCSDSAVLKSKNDSFWTAQSDIGIYELTVSDINPRPDLNSYIELSTGRSTSLEYKVTAGEAGIITTNLLQDGLVAALVLLAMMLLRRTRQ